jgi:DNA-binding beta-propeller fold protein YncE
LSNEAKSIRFEVVDDWGAPTEEWDFTEVADVAVGRTGDVFAFGRTTGAIQRFSEDGKRLDRWGTDQFTRPHGVTIHPGTGSLYCVDCEDYKVGVYTPEGRKLQQIDSVCPAGYTGYIPGDSFSVRQSGPPFCSPTSVDFGPHDDMYISDGYGNARVHHFSLGGELLDSWGVPGGRPGEFVLPHGVLVVGDRVYVADRENDRVQVFDLDGSYLTEWNDCYRPSAFCRDGDGVIFLAELGRIPKAQGTDRSFDFDAPPGRITARTASGEVIATLSSRGSGEGDVFFAPHGLAVDEAGDLYVAEVEITLFRGQAPPRPSLHKYRRI